MTIYTIKSSATAMPETSFLQLITDLLKVSGVFDISGTQFQVSAGSGLSVNIAAGRAYLLASGGNGYPLNSPSTISNLAINTNSSGNPRITSTVLYLNVGGSPNADGSGLALIMNVDGTPAASPSAPSGSTIQSAVGAGNPYTVLAQVTVNSGASVPTAIVDARTAAVFSFSSQSGWTPGETWTYISPTSFSVSGDVTGKYQVGDKLRLKQGGNYLYFYVISNPSYSAGNTTISIIGDLNAPLANAIITNNDFSKVGSPVGFPDWLNYTPTYGASGSMTFTSVTTDLAKFKISGRQCLVVLSANGTIGGSASNLLTATLPVSADDTANHYRSGFQTADGSYDLAGQAYIGASSMLYVGQYTSNNNYSSGIGRTIRGQISYGI